MPKYPITPGPVVSFRRVREKHGWLSNMSPHPVIHHGRLHATAESLFQSLRFARADYELFAEIRKHPRAEEGSTPRSGEWRGSGGPGIFDAGSCQVSLQPCRRVRSTRKSQRFSKFGAAMECLIRRRWRGFAGRPARRHHPGFGYRIEADEGPVS